MKITKLNTGKNFPLYGSKFYNHIRNFFLNQNLFQLVYIPHFIRIIDRVCLIVYYSLDKVNSIIVYLWINKQ